MRSRKYDASKPAPRLTICRFFTVTFFTVTGAPATGAPPGDVAAHSARSASKVASRNASSTARTVATRAWYPRLISGGCFGMRRAKCFTKGSSKYPRDTQHALAPDASSLVLITPRSASGGFAPARRAEPDPAAANAGGGGGMDDITEETDLGLGEVTVRR